MGMCGAGLGFFIVLAALGIWYLLKRTRLRLPAHILLAVLCTILTATLLIWLSVCASILLYQLNDPVSW